jgi:hypothetical protein
MTLKEGDEIVVCAKLINYMGNTPETNQGGKLISVNVIAAISERISNLVCFISRNCFKL